MRAHFRCIWLGVFLLAVVAAVTKTNRWSKAVNRAREIEPSTSPAPDSVSVKPWLRALIRFCWRGRRAKWRFSFRWSVRIYQRCIEASRGGELGLAGGCGEAER